MCLTFTWGPQMASYANNDAYGNPWGNPAWGGAQGNGPGQARWNGPGESGGGQTWSAPPSAGQGWPGQGWNGPGWSGPFGWHPARLGKAASIGLIVLGFMFWWPVGLAALFYM